MAKINWDKIQTIDETPAKTQKNINWDKVKTYDTKTDLLKSYGQDALSLAKNVGKVVSNIKPLQIQDVQPTKPNVKSSKDIKLFGQSLGNINFLNEVGVAEKKLKEEEQRKAQRIKDLMDKDTSKIGSTIVAGGLKVGKGLAKFGENILDQYLTTAQLQPRINMGLGTSVPVPKEVYEKTSGKKYEPEKSLATQFVKKDLSKAFDTASKYFDDASYIKTDSFSGKILENIGSMIPTILGGGYASTAITAFGSAAEQALNEGASLQEATLYGIGNSAIEIGTEALTGGIPGLKGSFSLDSLVAKKLLKQEGLEAVSKSISKAIIKAGYKMAGEAGEEALASLLQPLLRKAVYKQGETIDWEQVKKDVIESALIGGIVGGILNLPGTITDIQQSKQTMPNQPITAPAQEQTQPTQPQVEQPTKPIEQPSVDKTVTPKPIEESIVDIKQQTKTETNLDTRQRGVYKSLITNQGIPAEVKANIKKQDTNYMVITDADALDIASKNIAKSGIDKQYKIFKNRVENYEQLSKYDIAEATMLANEYFAKGDTNKYYDLVSDIAVAGTESGQVSQATSILQKSTPDGRVMSLQKQINKINNDNKGKKNWQDITLDTEDINAIKNSTNKKELDTAVNQAIANISAKLPKTIGNRVKEWRYLAMLGNPKTHIRNIVSNVAMKGVSKVKNIQAALFEDIFRPQERTKTLKRADKKTIDFVKQDAIDQKSRIQGTDKYDIGKGKINPKQAKLSEFNSEMLELEDWVFSSKAYKNAMANYITANNLDVDNISATKLEQAREYAIKEAQYQTFRTFNSFAETMSKIENKNIGTKILIGGIVPFKTTPMNIAKTAIEYSPIGLAKTITKNSYDLKNGKINGSQFIDNISKGLTGTAITTLGYILADMGILRASGSKEDKEEYYLQAMGYQPYSLQLGGKSYTLDWLSPAAIPLFIGAEYSELKKDGFDDSKVENIVSSLSTMLDPLTEMSMLQGLNRTLSSYEQNKLGGIVVNTATNFAGQFIPTVSGQIARVIDTKRRDTTGQGTGTQKTLDSFINKQIAKIPFASKTLQPYTNQFGKEEKTGNLPTRLFQNFLSPGFLKDINVSDIDKELLKLYKNSGEKSILPNSSSRYFTDNKKKIVLTPKEYTEFNKTDGEFVLKQLNDLFNLKGYETASEEQKIKAIENIYRAGQKVAKYNYLQNK